MGIKRHLQLGACVVDTAFLRAVKAKQLQMVKSFLVERKDASGNQEHECLGERQ